MGSSTKDSLWVLFSNILLYRPRSKFPYYQLSGVSEPYFYTSFFSGINARAGDDDKIALKDLIKQYNPQTYSLEWVMSGDSFPKSIVPARNEPCITRNEHSVRRNGQCVRRMHYSCQKSIAHPRKPTFP